ncbi:integrase catalytic domain-containing protein [Teichococcus aestuarii]|uniref:Transposase n=1 Tax=Teichococcus aestuarii TaxID=568898 RepID=A0A2U1UYU4_9PROT|nr:DDE-type integrase/transposase/recombinase [Pseudoroseomonas aestuarii]PWC26807.1 transposase [Pseudoroseomonas aestuarii]
MARRISMAGRTELLAAVSTRYGGATRLERSRILDEFAAVTGYHRKHAIRLLSGWGTREMDALHGDNRDQARSQRCRYGPEIRDALIQLCEVADRVCSKRLQPMIAVLLPALERHGQVMLDETSRAKLLEVSAATIDRLLAGVRLVAGSGRRRPAGFGSAVRRSVPIRTFNDWSNPIPGWVEVDFVAHGGTTVSGGFVQTMVLTDVATGWTECIPIVIREAEMVVHALGRARELFPFPLRGVDFDNDSLFMNDLVVGWCRAEGLEVTRSRAYRKNDQAWVEQKNGAIVRRLVGYGRFEGVLAGESLGRLYASARLHGNLFQPSFKLREKRREGARVIKHYHAPEPPVMRTLAHASVSEADKVQLRGMLADADPVLLLAGIRAAQVELGKRVDARGIKAGRAETPAPLDLALFTASLKVAWEAGEQRPTHRRRYVRIKPIVRPSMLDAVRDHLLIWLEAKPALTAVAALDQLRALYPDRFTADHLRTVQRFMKVQRLTMAREILLGLLPHGTT